MWIEKNPNATKEEKILAMAEALIGSSCDPSENMLLSFGLTENDWPLQDDPPGVCSRFDSIAMRCSECDWWVDASEVNEDGACQECQDQ